MFTAFNNAVPTPMYNYQPVIPKPEVLPGFDEEIQRDLPTMIFLAGIPHYIDDDDILELLAACGSVKSWKRVVNADNSPTAVGFCTFEKEIGVIKAMRSIPRPVAASDPNNATAGIPKGPNIAKEYEELNTLKIYIDIATRNHIRTDPEYGVKKVDYEVIEKKKQLFEPFVGVDIDKLYQEINPAQLVLKQNLFEEEEEEEKPVDLEKRQKEKEFAFQERLRRFSSNQMSKKPIRTIADYEHARDQMAVYLKNYDDDRERKEMKHEFYRDPERWWAARSRFRQQEEGADKRDAQAERQEMHIDEPPKPPKAVPLQQTKAPVIDFASRQAESESFKVSKILTQQERMELVKELVAKIPSDPEPLFSYNLPDNMDSIILKKLETFIAKKLTELKSYDKLLVDFCVSCCKNNKPLKLKSEVEKVLDDDALEFSMLVWRMVVYETEAKAMGI